jgi:hypothetical protein
MLYRLKKDFPKHNEGEYLYMNENNLYYEWLETPNYPLPIDVVEDCSDFFEKKEIDWVCGEDIFYISSDGKIINQKFNTKSHLKLVLSKNAFKNKDNARWFLGKYNKILNDEIIISDKEDILNIIRILKNNEAIQDAITILNKLIK